MNYRFHEGQRVRYTYALRYGVVETCVPGNGSIEWYYVRWNDGTIDRYTWDQLEAA